MQIYENNFVPSTFVTLCCSLKNFSNLSVGIMASFMAGQKPVTIIQGIACFWFALDASKGI